ncbi:MAG TPA: hypothetical protein VGG39_33340 [Polyangiaceae bacterium]
MRMLSLRSFALASAMVAFVPLGSACYVDEDVPPAEYAAEDGYEPPTYDGYVVYYDDVGRPFYYVNGGVAWIPATSPFYVGYVNHWRTYGPAYHRWYAAHGYAYRGWRGSYRGAYHGGYHGGYSHGGHRR